jgi:hypothetical protein
VASEYGQAHEYRALKPIPLHEWDVDKGHAYLPPDNTETLATDELAHILGKQRSYRIGGIDSERFGASVELEYSSKNIKRYRTPCGYAPEYPDLTGAAINVSRKEAIDTWKKRLADPALKPGHAKVRVRLTGEHLPDGTPSRWEAKLTNDGWQITHPNPYVYKP